MSLIGGGFRAGNYFAQKLILALGATIGTSSSTTAGEGLTFGEISLYRAQLNVLRCSQAFFADGLIRATSQGGSVVAIGGVGPGGAAAIQFSAATVITHGNGTPEGTVTATPGSLYLNRDGGALTTLWVKESGTGNTGWVAK